MKRFYSDFEVRTRMLEFLGGDSLDTATCEYLTAGDIHASHHREPRPVRDLTLLWERDLDIGRSHWDRASLLLDLDIEYVNFDFPGEAYLNPQRIFELQKPVEWTIEAILADFKIEPLHLLSGRGHHFVWRVAQSSNAFRSLEALGRVPRTLAKLNARPHRPNNRPVPPTLGSAFAGAALLMEYLAHRIKEEAAAMCEIPVEITAVEVGPRRHGREMISIDISEYGDPLSTRVIRVPFSRYLKPQQQRQTLGGHVVNPLRPIFTIPANGIPLKEGIHIMRDAVQVAKLAWEITARIPDQNQPMELALAAYHRSTLKQFHDWYYSQEHEPPEIWPETYDRLDLNILPVCVRRPLEYPNDLLLRPAYIKNVTYALLALGWHPRHIAGLIRSRYERNCNWGSAWAGYDPATRADFYTRLFAGLFVARADELLDFNCQSAKEEKLCDIGSCQFNLEQFKTSLQDRRKYERLASGPFNRLFLPEEHL